MNLKNRRALVTGASGSLGAAVTRRLAAAGADVAVHYHGNAQAAAALAADVAGAGGRTLALKADLSRADQAQSLIERIAAAWEGLDLLVNCAGIAPVAPWDEITPEQWLNTLALNLSGPFYVLWQALPLLEQSSAAAVVNVGSVAGLNGGGFGPAYAATKAGMIGLTRSAARELGPRGIRVNCVAPGPLQSPMAHSLPAAALTAMAAATPLGRLGQPEEAAAVIVWLLSPAAALITGQTVVVDGGRVMH